MGIFDLFRSRKNDSPEPATRAPSGKRFAGDRDRMFNLNKTHRLEVLFHTPKGARDSAWTEAFYDAAWYASIELSEPVHFSGPDGFSYYRLNLPRPNASFDSQSLGNLARQCCERYAGAAIFASPDAPESAPEFVFTAGLLDSMLRYDSPLGDPVDRSETMSSDQDENFKVDDVGLQHQILTVAQSHKVMTGAPSADYLPPYAARGIERYMSHIWNIKDPHVCLLVDPSMQPTRSLVIGRKRSSFASDTEMASEMNRITWFLPVYRSLIAMPEDWTTSKMHRLSDLIG